MLNIHVTMLMIENVMALSVLVHSFSTTCCGGAKCCTECNSVVLHNSPSGFGKIMSGSNPVFILSLQEDKFVHYITG